MKNIHLFETKNAYDTAKSGLILPRVSYIKENKVVDYNPHHDYIEIAGIKWATMNVGANSITDYGLYFQWGATQGYTKDEIEKEHKKKFASDWSDYTKFTTDGGKTFTKYNPFNKTVLDLEDDAVHAAWGGSWRMPTTDEFDKLKGVVTTAWTDSYNDSGVAGLLCTATAKTDTSKTLFFPACGYAYDGAVDFEGVNGYYWLSSLYTGEEGRADILDLSSGDAWVNSSYFYNGLCVRGVLAEN